MPDRSVVYRLKADITSFRASMAQASAATRKAAGDMTSATKEASKFRSGLTTVGNAGGKMGLVAAVGLGAIVLVTAKFDKAMSAVQAATHGSTRSMEQLREAAIKAGADTVFSASEAAGGIEELAKAGVSTKDILAGGLSGALNLAAAGAIGVSEAAETAATAMTQFKLGGDQVNHVADLLAAGAGKAQGGVSDLGMALKQSGLVAAQTGLSINETVGALAEFASAGLIGSDAGTSFKTMLQALTPNGAKAKEAMDKLGISAYDAAGNFVGMTKFAGSLKDGLSKLSVEQQNAALKTIFGSDAVRAASIIFKDGAEGVDKWQKKVNDAGYAAETAGTRMDNLAGDFEQFKGSLETALIGAGEGSQGPLRKLTQGATEAVNAFSGLPGPVKNTASALLGITAVTGGALWFGAKFVGGITAAKGALVALGITAEGTRAKLALVGAGGTAAALGIGTLVDTISLMDSRSRSGAAADATVKSFQDLSDALSYSNVGKFADDLHINLGRLAEDLFQNGEQGEYATRIMDQLGESSHGAGAYFNALGGLLPFYTANADKASDANKDLGNIIDKNSGILGSGAEATKKSATATDQLTGAAHANAAALKAQRAAAAETAQSFLNLSKNATNAKVSLNGWINQMANQSDALRNFTNNATIAANRGLRDGLIKQLQKMGPEGALRMKQLANGTDAQLKRANHAFDTWKRTSRDATDAVGGGANSAKAKIALMNAEIKRTKGKLIHMDEKGAAAARARIAALRAEIANLRDKTVTVHIRKDGSFKTAGGNIGEADGGFITGPGGPRDDMIDARLSNGEFVVNAAATARNLTLLHKINSQRFADGGQVLRLADGGRASRDDDGHHRLRDRINKLTKAIERSKTVIDKERTARGDLVSKRNDLASTVGGNFTSDLFGSQPDNLSWMNPAQRQAALTGGVLSTLKSDIANANTFKSTLASLKKRGLDGQALASLASSGDVGRAQAFSNMSTADLGQFKSLFNQRATATAGVGAFAGNAVYGVQIAAQTTALQTLVKQNAALAKQLKALEKKPKTIHVHDKSGSPHKTAKEVSRRQAMG